MRTRALTLTTDERQGLESLVRRHSTPQRVATRARIVLAAAAGQPLVQIAQQVGLSRESVRLWRDRWVALEDIPLAELSVAQRLADVPRPGAPARITAELLQYPVLDAHLSARDGTGPPAWCVLNGGSGAHLDSRRRQITDETGLRVVSYVPHDWTAVMAAQERQLPLTVARRDSPAAQALWRVAERVWHLPPRPRGVGTGS
jgi:hypothetical protein